MIITFAIFIVMLPGKLFVYFNVKKLISWKLRCILHHFFWLGLVQSQKVDQSPRDLIRKLTESAVLTCSHSDQGFELILWYKRSDDKGLIFLGYLNTMFAYPEDEFKQKIDLAGDGRSKATLTIKNLTEDSSGVYYCAARRHSVINPHNPAQKHPYHILISVVCTKTGDAVHLQQATKPIFYCDSHKTNHFSALPCLYKVSYCDL